MRGDTIGSEDGEEEERGEVEQEAEDGGNLQRKGCELRTEMDNVGKVGME